MNKQLASKNIKLTCRAFAALPDTKNKATSANMEKLELFQLVLRIITNVLMREAEGD